MGNLVMNGQNIFEQAGTNRPTTGAGFPAGHVINVYTNRYGDAINNTTEDWTDLQVGITVTPVSLSSKFFIQIYCNFSNTTSGAHGIGLLFKRDTTFLNRSPHDGGGSTPVDGSTYRPYDYYKDESRIFFPFNRFIIDSPNTTNPITYSAWAKGYMSTTQGTLEINVGGLTDTEFIIMELA